MNKQICLLLGLGFFLTACEDVSSNRKTGESRRRESQRPEVTTPLTALKSQLHRDRGSKVLSLKEEITQILEGRLAASYRIIPLMDKDDEGSALNVLTVNQLGRPATDCGAGADFQGIDARIADCKEKNGDQASWSGEAYGASGEGSWRLVSRATAEKEIWLDESTGLVWSYLQTDANETKLVNWCKASGNDQNASNGMNFDCSTLSSGESLCAGAELPEVIGDLKWRLPTRNDFLQADLNGLRFVLSNEGSEGLWTATMRATSTNRTEAWVYRSLEGTLSPASLDSPRYVRCVGAPKR